MASTTLAYDIFARDRGASTTFDKIGNAATRNSGQIRKFGQGFAAVGVGIARTATVAAGALGALGVAGAAMGLKTASSLQQAAISFETLLGSATKATRFLGQLTAFAARTPFQVGDVISYSRALLGAGEAARKIVPSLTAWGNASGALGLTQDQFSRTMLAVTQIMNRGKVQGDDLKQITQAGIPIWTLMSRALGKPISSLQEMAKKGELLSKDVLPALEAQMGKDYGGAMGKQALTLSGLWSTFTDTLSLGLAKVATQAVPALQNALPQAIAAVGTKLAEFAGWVSTTAIPTIRDLWATFKDNGSLASVGSIFASLGAVLASFVPSSTDAAGGMNSLRDALANIATVMEWVSEHTTALKVVVLGLAIAFGGPLTALTALGAAFVWAWQKSETFRDIVVTAAEVVVRGFSGLLTAIGAVLKALSWLPGYDWADRAAEKVNGLRDSLNGAADGLAAIRDNNPVNLNIAVNYIPGTGEAPVGMSDFVGPGTKGFIGPVAGGRNDPNFIGPVGPGGGPKIGAKRQTVEAAHRAGAAAGTALADGISSATTKASAAAQKLTDAAKAKFDELKSAAKALGDSVRDSVSGWFTLADKGNPFAGMDKIAAKVSRFAHALGMLVKQHVSPALISMIAQAGPDAGYRAAMELSHATKADRSLVGRKFEQIQNAANRAGAIVAGTSDPGIQVAKSQLDELRGIRRAVTKSSRNPHHAAGFAAP